jgi:hypothetical protein
MSLGKELREIDPDRLSALVEPLIDKEYERPDDGYQNLRESQYPALTALIDKVLEIAEDGGVPDDEQEGIHIGLSIAITALVEYAEIVETEAVLPGLSFPTET